LIKVQYYEVINILNSTAKDFVAKNNIKYIIIYTDYNKIKILLKL